MPNYFDRHTATGASRIQKINLSIQGEIDLDLIHKTDIGKIPIRINKTTIILKKK